MDKGPLGSESVVSQAASDFSSVAKEKSNQRELLDFPRVACKGGSKVNVGLLKLTTGDSHSRSSATHWFSSQKLE